MLTLATARAQIGFARAYTVRLLQDIPPDEWFRMPQEGVTHVAWQVGHLAFAQYRLALLRLRGPRPDDAALLSPEFLKKYGADSVPDPDPARSPPAAVIRAVFDQVHERVMQEVAGHPEEDLDTPITLPHPIAKTKGDALFWCAQHELVHAGQIALLRRLFGKAPLW
jgi:hypothetical protein